MGFTEASIPEEKVFDGLVFPKTLLPPATIEKPTVEDAVKLVKEEQESLTEIMNKNGAILLRGFGLATAEDFSRVIVATGWEEFQYRGAVMRKRPAYRVFTANEAPPEINIGFHHEMALIKEYPPKLIFFCETPPPEGGQTAIIRSDVVVQKMEELMPDVVEKLEREGIRFFHVRQKDTWQRLVGVNDPVEAERAAIEKLHYCNAFKYNAADGSAEIHYGPIFPITAALSSSLVPMGFGGGAVPRRRQLSINTTTIPTSQNSSAAAAEEEVVVEEPLSPASRMFHQPSFNCFIIAVMGMGCKIDVAVIRDGLEASLARHPRFSSVLVLDEPRGKKSRWVRTKVVVENHLVVPDMETGATSNTPDQLLEDYLSSLTTTTLDFSRPLWDLHILNIRTSDAEAVAVLRVHHSLGDGISLMSLLLSCTRKTSDPNSLPTVPEARRPDPGKRHSLWTILMRLWAVMVLIWNTLVDLMLFVATAAFLQDTKTPLKGSAGVEFRRKQFVHKTVSLDDVKTIKNKTGCTVNDVLVGITSASLSRYLSRSFNKGNKGKKSDLPANILIRTTLLVNIRQAPGIQNLAEMMKGRGGCARWGNRLGYMVMPFSILKCEDPLDYVRKGKVIAARKKKSLEAFLTNKAAFWVVKIFGIKAATTLCHRVLSHTTLSFSNISGPVEEIGFYGHPLTYIAPSVYGHPQALTLHFQSYMNKLTMVAAVDEQTVPDPLQLLDDLAESLRLIKDAAEASS